MPRRSSGSRIGVVVWQLRPDSRTGILLTAWPFVALLARAADRLRRLHARRDDRLRDELARRADLRAPRPLVPERAAPLQARPGGRRARVRARGRVRARDGAPLRPAAAVGRDDHVVRAPRGADHARPRLGGGGPARRVRPVAAPPRRALPRAARPQARAVDAGRAARRPAPRASRPGSSRSSSSSSSRSSASR